MKKFLLLTLIMCLLGGLSSSLMAQFNLTYNQDATNQYTLTFTPTSDTECAVQMNKGNAPGAETDLVIPATVENNGKTYKVVSIPNNAFSGASSYIDTASDYFTSLTIPNTVVSIGQYAFRYWSNCTTVILGEGVTSISKQAFANSSSITTIYCYANTPPAYDGNAVFHTNVKNNAKVYVPANSLNEYKKEATSGYGWAYININNFYAMSSTPTAPTAPTLNSPTNGEPDIFNPSLNFSLGDNTTHYQVLIAEANGTGTPIGDYNTLIDWTEKTSTVSYQTSHLKPNTTYSWKVVARNGEGEDAPTTESSASFTTRNITSAPGAITIVSPTNGATDLVNPVLSWEFGLNTEEFQLWFGQDPDNLEKKSTGEWENTENLTEIYTYTPSNLSSGTYYWRVDTRNTAGQDSYNTTNGELYSFSVASLPDNVTPISPADGATGVTSAIVRFRFAPNTTEYRLLYSDTNINQMSYITVNNGGTGSTWTSTGGATEMKFTMPYYGSGKTFYWAVDVKNDLGQRSVWNGGEDIAIYSFTTSSVAAATYNSPVNGAILDQTSATLNWKYNHNGDAQYQVLAGTDSEYLEVKQDWTAAEGTGGAFTLSDLNLNTKYYWQVNVKNNEGTAEGEIWWFASLENPTMTNESNIYSVNKVEITWNEIAEASSYNVYSKENETETLLDNVSEGRYEFSPNQDTYTFVVKAVYDGIGESTGSTSTINISKFVDVECNVTNNLNNNQVVENATIKFIGITTLGDAFEQTFTTDSNGTFSDNIPCGVYDIKVSANRFDNGSLTDLDLASGKTYTYSIKLEPELPGNVTPISPADSATNVNNPTIVSWEFAENTTQYRVLISDDTTNFRYVNGGEWLDVENEECSFPTDNLGLITGQQVWWCVDVKNDLNAVRSFWNSENKPALYNFTLSDHVSVNCTSPTQNEVLNNTDVTLQWNYGKGNNVTHYKVSLWDCNGTELLKQDWTVRATDGTGLVANGNYIVSLDPTMKYTWRVDVKKNEDGEVIEGKLMSFITPLEVPSISTESHNIYTANTNIEWNNTGNHVNGYNIYLNDILYNNELTKTNSYEVTDLTRNIEEGHKIQVTAIYKFGDGNNYESNKSEAITVKVIGYANISGFVKNTNKNVIEGATIKFTGTDAFENEREISTESDENGAYIINIPEGTYVRTVEKEGYFNDTIKSKEYAASNITNDITLVSSAIFTVEVNASINDIDIRLSNNNWPDDANFSGSYNIYYKEDNDKDATGPLNNYFAKEPYSTTLLLADKAEFRTIWTTLPNGTYKIGVQQGSNEINWCTESIVRNYSVIGTDGSWNEGSNWTDGKVADENAVVSVTAHITIDSDVNVKSISISRNNASLTIKKGCTLTAEEVINEGSPSNLKLEDGAQLRQGNSELNGQFIMNVVTPTIWAQNNVTGWQFISMPFTDAKISTFTNNANNEGGRYDLYRFDGRVKDEEWINQKDAKNNFETEFRLGYGYLASSEFAETFVSNGNFSTYSGKEFVYKLDTISGESNYSRFYLLGNPFSFDMNWDDVQHTGIVDGYATVNKYGTYNYHAGGTIPVGDGFFVKAEGNTIIPSISYNENVRSRAKAESLNITVGNKDGEDNVVLSFAGTDKEGFPKLDNFNDRIANIFVLDNDIRYGIFNYDRDVEEIELAFIASEMGKYTISIEADGKFEAITLVDRFTGIETNMMFEDYTFTATSLQDYNRFIVRLSMNKGDVQEDEHFVYQSGEDLIIDAEGLVQIIDVMGRVVYSSDINGKSRVDVSNFKDASYVIRVVNEKEVKTQKVVIF